jgi:tol-pal system protein YbgF
MTIRSTRKRWLTGVVFAAAVVAATTTASEAAWWNLGKKATEPAAGNAPVTVAQSADADRVNQLETQVRSLTGQLEELSYQLQQLRDQLQRLQEDADFRLRALEGDAAPPPRTIGQSAPATQPQVNDGAMAAAPNAVPPAAPMNQAENQAAAPPMAGPGAPPKPLGQLVVRDQTPADGQPLDLSALARGDAGGNAAAPAQPAAETPQANAPAQAVAAVAPSGNPTTDFSRAYNLYNAGQYQLAEQSFRQFLSAYPDDQEAPDAQYWLGESLFSRGLYRDAADAFRAGYKAYPNSSRAPATLLRLGQAMAGLGEGDAACQIYAQVLKDYPDMSNALRQRVITEKASARC